MKKKHENLKIISTDDKKPYKFKEIILLSDDKILLEEAIDLAIYNYSDDDSHWIIEKAFTDLKNKIFGDKYE